MLIMHQFYIDIKHILVWESLQYLTPLLNTFTGDGELLVPVVHWIK